MKKILLIATGGTIASKNCGGGLAPAITSEELISYIPEIKEICKVDTIQVLNIDSTNLQPEYWLIIVNAIKENYAKYDGFVISHGTDTMAYTSSALSYLIQDLDKPIIITGSQKPITAEGTDAKKNLVDSFRFVVESDCRGIYVVFDGKAIIGTRARKTRSKSYSAFESINYPYAAYINNNEIVRFTKNEEIDKEVKFFNDIYPSIFLLKLVPGMDPDVLDYIGEKYEGVVIESYGVGGIPFNDRRNFLDKLGTLTSKGKIVVIATQVALEGSDMSVYEVGMKALNNYKVLQAYDMTIEAAVTKLMWILSETKEYDKVKEKFYTKINEDILID
ncbi:asparaginase [Sedimentibacter sp. zth1]|uniref:asparaginase n=1 Tax=Sedimentibacter sp. zth1 TaxID=2816908 RepID=UPI001A93683B|nr:asparaginase [Sedimentibacter sp. zth1]QSX04739.1 asparaginase [Sedimentibacter sp. zth1]